MTVISRQVGTSIFLRGSDDCVLTLIAILPDNQGVSLLNVRASADKPGLLETRTFKLKSDRSEKLDDLTEIRVVDVRGTKARIGISAPKQTTVHRLEDLQTPQ